MSYVVNITLDFDTYPSQEDILKSLQKLIDHNNHDFDVEQVVLARTGVEL